MSQCNQIIWQPPHNIWWPLLIHLVATTTFGKQLLYLTMFFGINLYNMMSCKAWKINNEWMNKWRLLSGGRQINNRRRLAATTCISAGHHKLIIWRPPNNKVAGRCWFGDRYIFMWRWQINKWRSQYQSPLIYFAATALFHAAAT